MSDLTLAIRGIGLFAVMIGYGVERNDGEGAMNIYLVLCDLVSALLVGYGIYALVWLEELR